MGGVRGVEGIGAVPLSAGVGSAAALAAFGDQPLAGTVTIGVVGPFTGDTIRLGEQMGNGVRAAIDDANRFRGTLDRAYAIRTFDDENLLASGLVNAQFACDDPTVVAVIGHLSGRITEAAMQTYVTNRMPVICPASTYDRLTAHGYGNLVRLTTKDSIEGRLAARYLARTVRPKSVVTLYQDGDYGSDVAAGLQEQLLGDKIAATAIGFSWDKPDFAAVVKTALARSPDVVYLAGIPHDMGPIVPTLRQAGYAGAFFGSQGFFDTATLKTYGKELEGLVVSTSTPPLALAPGAFRIKNDYERRYGAISPLAAFSYAAAQIVIAIVRRTGATDRLAVDRAFSYGTSYDTVVGPMAFASDGDPQNPNAYFYAVRDGAWRYVTAANPSTFVVK
ncbi:MAG: branched-chain amino acid ABC transporter substrate-binding protein [Vulcanimicrobiaceae bacterium]